MALNVTFMFISSTCARERESERVFVRVYVSACVRIWVRTYVRCVCMRASV